MTARIHLARHGQTVWHAENRYAGVSDVALTDQGRAQAAALGRWAADEGLSAVVSSDLSRAVETARIVAEIAGLPRYVEPTLRESDFGRGEGLTRAEMADRFPEELAAFLDAPASSPLPGGEPGAQAAERFVSTLQRLVDPDAQPVLVVAHTTVVRLSLCRLLGIPLDDYRTVFPSLGNCTVTTVALETAEGGTTGAMIRYNSPTAA